jgi:hypothetical protein
MAHEHLSDATLRHAYDNPSVRAQGFPNNGGDSCEYVFPHSVRYGTRLVLVLQAF